MLGLALVPTRRKLFTIAFQTTGLQTRGQMSLRAERRVSLGLSKASKPWQAPGDVAQLSCRVKASQLHANLHLKNGVLLLWGGFYRPRPLGTQQVSLQDSTYRNDVVHGSL